MTINNKYIERRYSLSYPEEISNTCNIFITEWSSANWHILVFCLRPGADTAAFDAPLYPANAIFSEVTLAIPTTLAARRIIMPLCY